MKTLIINLLGCVSLVLSIFVQASEFKLEIIPLHFRSSSEIIPVIEPFLAEGGSVTGLNDQLIVKSTPSNISEIKILLEKIDKKPRRLMITVSNEITESSGRREHAVTGNYSADNVEITNKPKLKGSKGSSLSVSDADTGSIQYRLDSTKSSSRDNNNFQLQTLEGQPAYIDTGKLIPVTGRTAYIAGSGIIVQDNVEYHDTSSGFYVVPSVNGDIVTLLISPYMSRENPKRQGVFDIQNVETTVQGHLGEWIEIGGIEQQSSRDNSGILYNRQRQSGSAHSLSLKVEELE